MTIDPIKIIKKYYNPESEAYRILIEHGKAVAKKALELAERIHPHTHLRENLETNQTLNNKNTLIKVMELKNISDKVGVGVKHLSPDLEFIKEAAMLHDVGIFLINEPRLDCHGDKPYIAHGYLGRELLEKEGLSRHALVCERHVGVGITLENIEKNNLPLPKRDMTPQSIEEKIICLADKFFSKKELLSEKTIEEIKSEAAGHGPENARRIEELLKIFNLTGNGG